MGEGGRHSHGRYSVSQPCKEHTGIRSFPHLHTELANSFSAADSNHLGPCGPHRLCLHTRLRSCSAPAARTAQGTQAELPRNPAGSWATARQPPMNTFTQVTHVLLRVRRKSNKNIRHRETKSYHIYSLK